MGALGESTNTRWSKDDRVHLLYLYEVGEAGEDDPADPDEEDEEQQLFVAVLGAGEDGQEKDGVGNALPTPFIALNCNGH